ncbi:solute carrier family 2, facilitated glucose transporter member 5-like [Mytilus californianus]|uniref:solute carrier family 2, facilitated glucose transporter member 5-like n=1 Tax=Mytilus californianus TaxID=6549 RepID=UPI002247B7C9|nr:solute carrier family 2, facilitated glucose transporter member 5-like [Mytilus californianus]
MFTPIGFFIKFEMGEVDIKAGSTTTLAQRGSILVTIIGNTLPYGYNMAVLNNPAVNIIAYYNKTNGRIPSEVETREYVDWDYDINLVWSSVNAVYVLAGFIGVLFAEKIAAKYGRRKPMMVNTVLVIIASAVGGTTFISDSIWVLVIHRISIGLYCGIGLVLSGMYAMEISKFTLNRVKGSYGTYDRWFQLSITAGICISSFLGISTFLGNEDRWQWLLVFNIVPALSNVFLYWCPESPVYLVIQGKIDMAKKGNILKYICRNAEYFKPFVTRHIVL